MATQVVFKYDYNGRTITAPDISHPTIGMVRQMRNLDESEQAFWLVENLLNEKSLKIVDSMSVDDFFAFMKAWNEFSAEAGVTSPED